MGERVDKVAYYYTEVGNHESQGTDGRGSERGRVLRAGMLRGRALLLRLLLRLNRPRDGHPHLFGGTGLPARHGEEVRPAPNRGLRPSHGTDPATRVHEVLQGVRARRGGPSDVPPQHDA